MKKLLITPFILSTAMISAVYASPKDFSGPYLMGSIGGSYATVGASAFSAGGASLPGSSTNNTGGFEGGVSAGYLHKLSKKYPIHIGGKLGTSLSTASGKEKTKKNNTETKHTFDRPHAIQASLLLGYAVTDTIMPFLQVGWENALWKHKVTSDMAGTGTAKSNKRQNAFLVGGGVLKKVSKNASVGLMYEGSIHFDQQKSKGGNITAKHKDAQNHKFMTVVMWTFKK